MRLFTRQPGDVIRISDDIVVRIIGFYKDEIRLGFQAPSEISVDCKEIPLRKQ